ncbi:type II secretion system ATPase GspE [Halanaerobacter jeridensis]|uniref:protein-secreting ATPase n=1 Tax=Halanaerobacter jeridensis TaxID=706427 RepID=A0A938XUU3_9FIRM|nr:type II secretion system ATPase GspE [Halanaerobacter jeridensis]MBM7557958.1 type IV pilus assembly protein PilB [Halanaerobacter jeridensis]
MIKKKRLGDILVEAGFITEDQLNQALKKQRTTDSRLGEVLKNMGLINEEDVVEALEFQLGIPQVDLSDIIVDPKIAKEISQSMAEKHKAIPIEKEDNTLTVAMADPLDVMAIDDIRLKTGYEIDPVIALESELNRALKQHFGNEDLVNEFVSDMDEGELETVSEEEVEELKKMVDEAPVVKLANNIIRDGVETTASDIHIEPMESEVRVRYRIDGILHTEMNIPKDIHAALVSRMKIMADLDIAERRVPQDGRIQIIVNSKKIDLRVSTLPTVRGEKIVLRILDKSNLMLDLDQLGFSPQHKTMFRRMIDQPHGMILITGPTGSGKTTTLYSALSTLDNSDENLITVEDPVEYRLEGINQVQTNPKAGLTFATGLRSILRQDPDTIMVGEIRDKETAEMAVHSALTGHLVFSTLHTNHAAGALTRLIDMGVEPFLVASSVSGVMAQRLVRTICPNCKVKESDPLVDPELEDYLGIGEDSIELYKGVGCRKCNETGYKGRTAIHEILEMIPKIKELVVSGASAEQIEEAAKEDEMDTLETSSLRKVGKGLTTIEEAKRVTKVQLS